MLSFLPLMIVPLITYNIVALGGGAGPDVWAGELFSVGMMSGGTWRMTHGEGLLALGLAFLFVEVLKATRTSRVSVVDHMLSTLVFIAYLVEFLLVPSASHAVFFLLTCMALIDVIAGFSVSIRAAGRDVSFN